MTCDYEHHGTTTLFTALSVLVGKMMGYCTVRQWNLEFNRYLKKIDGKTPAGLDLQRKREALKRRV